MNRGWRYRQHKGRERGKPDTRHSDTERARRASLRDDHSAGDAKEELDLVAKEDADFDATIAASIAVASAGDAEEALDFDAAVAASIANDSADRVAKEEADLDAAVAASIAVASAVDAEEELDFDAAVAASIHSADRVDEDGVEIAAGVTASIDTAVAAAIAKSLGGVNSSASALEQKVLVQRAVELLSSRRCMAVNDAVLALDADVELRSWRARGFVRQIRGRENTKPINSGGCDG